jgi:hypothetical protein
VHEEAVRRWIRADCPCVSPGEIGRGHGARLNLQDVASWRAARMGAGGPGADFMERIEQVLYDTLRRDGGNGRPAHVDLGIDGERAATLLSHALSRIARALSGSG